MKTIFELAAPESAHKFLVVIHSSRASFRAALSKEDGWDKNAMACCVALEYPNKQSIVAELHFSKPDFSPSIVAHEAVHAISYRAKLQGVVYDTDAWEEYMAEGVQDLVYNILRHAKTI